MKIFTLLISLFFISPSAVYAWGMPELPVEIPGVGGGADLSDLESTQTELMNQTNRVVYAFEKALNHFQKALGLDVDEVKLEAKRKCLEEGKKSCITSEQAEAMKTQTEAVAEKITDMVKKGEKLSAEATATFVKGLVPYVGGLFEGGKLGLDITAFAPKVTNAVTANPLSAPSVLAEAMNIISVVPGVLSTFGGANGGIYDFATYSGLEIPDAETKIKIKF